MDFVFIDGSHDYDYVLNDSEVALKLLRNGRGVIVWHDYREEMAVVPALDEYLRRYPQLQIFHIAQTSFAFAEISGTEALK
jgi:predicted O-methyltransferase YrrM